MIICCGEALIDMLPGPIVGEADSGFLPVAGGASLNTAIALGRQGVKTALLCGISSDMFGDQLLETLGRSGVSLDQIIRSDRPTTLAFIKLTDGVANYSFYDENSALRMVQFSDMPPLPCGTKALQFGGISLASGPSALAYEQALNEAYTDHVITLDPNIRSGFIDDEKLYRDRLQRMMAKCDIIKVSDEDLDWLHPGTSFESCARAWISGGTSVVLQTRGAEGARAITADDDVFVPGQPVDVVDTVGAGDTFNAGFLVSLEARGLLGKPAVANLGNADLIAALEYAVLLATHTVGRAGANPPWKTEVSV